jgi:c-di-GMP-binding flagellar brake protein YcgR
MNELLEKEQIFNIIPKNLDESNKGKIINIGQNGFQLELFHNPKGLVLKHMVEFYSQTKNGMLFFKSGIAKIDGKIITVTMPRKHRFLQKRAFTRIKFVKDLVFKSEGNSFAVKSLDLSAGGMKIQTNEYLNINSYYEFNLPLLKGHTFKSSFVPIRIEKNDNDTYTLSGRFQNMSNIDKMALIQFCMRKSLENKNK